MPTSGELSLRHLPDVSDSSFSFQIPGAAQDYNLLAEDDLDFFSGANVSGGATSLSPAANTASLTLYDLTPRRTFETRTRIFKDLKRTPASSEEVFDKNIQKEEARTTQPQQPDLSKVRPKIMSNLRPITTSSFDRLPPADAPFSAARITTLRTDVDNLTADLYIPSPPIDQEPTPVTDNQRPKGIRRTSLEKKLPPSRAERRKKLVPRNKQIVMESGVTKSRPTDKASEIRSPAQISNSVEQPSPVFPSYSTPIASKVLNGDESLSDMSMGPMGGVAEHLVQYGQHFTNSFGLYNSVPSLATNDLPNLIDESHVVPKIAPNNVAPTAPSIDSDGPLTLSQVSPRKRRANVPTPPTPPANEATSSLRTSTKRPASAASESLPRKKGRKDASPAEYIGGGSSSSLAPTTRKPTVPKQCTASASASSSRSKPVGEEISKPKTRGNTIASKASTLRRSKPSRDESRIVTKSNSASTSTSSRSTRVLRNSRPQPDDDTRRPASSLLSKGKGKASSNSQTSERPIFQITPLDATKPVPFQSFTESRLLARKGGPSKGDAEAQSQSQSSQSQREKKYHIPIPDFQAMHAAQGAKLALLKEGIHPTVPHPIQLTTDLRMKERKRFDEMVKEKEREQERLNEEKRREREEQEERELRELRKKAVPKAHNVPEWYKEAPRKKDSKFDPLGR